jgi:hypothetical protein
MSNELENHYIHKGQRLEMGHKYRVTHRENDKQVRAIRIFKWPRSRFGTLQCLVFTTKVSKDVTATVDGDTLTIRGKRIPRQEVSMPVYDLISFEPVN